MLETETSILYRLRTEFCSLANLDSQFAMQYTQNKPEICCMIQHSVSHENVEDLDGQYVQVLYILKS